MDPLTAIAQAGSLVNGVKSLVGAIKGSGGKSQPAQSFDEQLRRQIQANAAGFIQERDRDGSGGLSASEFGGSAAMFSRLDTDSNGQLTAAELMRAAGAAASSGKGA